MSRRLVVTLLAGTACVGCGHSGSGATEASGAILFAGQRSGVPGLFVVNADGSGLKLVVRNAADARWSPDGTSIAYLRDTLEVVKSGEAVPVRLSATDVNGYSNRDSFGWSADGVHLAYANPAGAIFVVRNDGSDERTLVAQHGADPVWSPDGAKIAFTHFAGARRDDDDASGSSVYVVDADGRHQHILISDAFTPIWSPDGTKISFKRQDSELKEHLYVARTDGSDQRKLTADPADNDLASEWSPDGSKIALSGTFNFDDKTYVVNADASDLTFVGAGAGMSWSPDGTTLALIRDDDLWTVAPDGTRPHRVTKGGQFYGFFLSQWQPRGGRGQDITGVGPSPTRSLVEPRLLRTRQNVFALAAEGRGAAIAYPEAPDCLEMWRPQTGSARFKEEDFCGSGGFIELAVAGRRVTWLGYETGNGGLYPTILTATLDRRKPRVVLQDLSGRMLAGDLQASGSLVAFDTWKQEGGNCGDSSCFRQDKVNGALWLMKGTALKRIRSAKAGLTALALNAGRVAVLRGDGPVEIVGESGRLLSRLAVPRGVTGLALDGPTAVALTPTELLVYAATDGRLVHRWHLPSTNGAPKLAGLGSGIAAYADTRRVHLLRLSDGHRGSIEVEEAQAILTRAGLFYAVNVSDREYPGRVTLVPLRELLRQIA